MARDTYHDRPSKRDLQQKEERFDRFVEKLEHKATESDLTDEKKRERRQYIGESTTEAERERRWCKAYFPHIFTLPWNGAHLYISRAREGGHTVSGFRKCGKTAYAMVAKIIRPLVKGTGGMLGVNLRTQEKADTRSKMLYRMIESNRLIQHDYDVRVDQEKKGHYIINSTHLIAGSAQKGLRSFVDENFNRFKVAINDDLYDRTTVDSERDNEKIYNFVASEVDGQMEDDGLYITLGNSITEGCPINLLKEENPENHYSLPALNEEGESTWPEYKTAEEWKEKKETTAPDVWAGDYMDDPLVLGEVMEEEWLSTVNPNLIEVTVSLTALDPARGESPSASRKGAATLALTSSDEVVMLRVYARKESWDATFNWLREAHRQAPQHSVILFENDFAQWDLAKPYYRRWRKQMGAVLPFMMITTDELVTAERGQSKFQRIMNLVEPHQNGRFRYSKKLTGTADWEKYRKQFIGFGEKDDQLNALDATATAYIKIQRFEPGTTSSFRSTKERTFTTPEWTGGFR
jgi:hypothetical protein